ncbi:MAG: [FeFe] hydrogenase, group A, partial [Hungatella sp.]
MENITMKINGIEVSAPKGSTILEAARLAHIEIPTLCFLREINEIGACRICVVEVKGARSLVASCVHPVSEGMEVWTNTPKVLDSRRKTLQLILSDHDKKCLSCVRSDNCELQKLCRELGVDDEDYYQGERNVTCIDDSAAHMIRDNSKCILCRRCVAVCEKVQGIGVIGANERGFATNIGSAFKMGLGETSCVSCGQCIAICPTGALQEKEAIDDVLAAIAAPSKHVIVQTAPAVRAALGEAFGLPMGTNTQGKMVSALRRIGFDKVFDTNFGADLTIMEEAHEFLDRVQNDGILPMITSCSPGWIKYCEHYFPDMTENLSSCKSPQQMFGAIAKSYYAERNGLRPEDIVSVSIMPCTAKKFEIGRNDQAANGVPDVDYSLTTRELARMIKRVGLNFLSLPDEEFDAPLGLGTGAAVIFGATGGVMEAALRTAVETLTGEELASLDFTEVRGMEGIKEAVYP